MPEEVRGDRMIRRIRWRVRYSAQHWLVAGADGAATETFVFTGNRLGWERALDKAFKEARKGMDEVS